MKRLFLLLFGLVPIFSSFGFSFFRKNISDSELIQVLIEEMTAEEKIGQLFMLGYLEAKPDRFLLTEIEAGRIGNVKVFGWNATDTDVVAEAVAEMQKAAAKSRFAVPLIVATDQEGGWVRHVKGKTSITPGNNAIGATGELYDAYESGRLIAAELRLLGINMNFAPVVDLFDDPNADLIGPRTFGADPKTVADLAIAFFHGQEASRVLSTAKHFPGHGRTGIDSHIFMPRIPLNEQQLKNRELIPFAALVKEKIPAIMSGHLNYPQITGEGTSASLSPAVLKDLLREEMGYNGLVITDDLLMGGAQKPGIGYPRIIAECISAGNDIVLISKDYKYYRDAFANILQLYRSDEKFRTEVERAVKRVLKAKVDYLRPEDRVPLFPSAKESAKLPMKESARYQQSLALRAVTVPSSIEPVNKATPLLLAGSYTNMDKAGKTIFANSRFYFIKDFSRGTNQFEVADAIARTAETEKRKIVLLISDTETAAVGRVLNDRGVEFTVFSSLNPHLAAGILRPRQEIVYLYGVGYESFRAAFSVLAGDFKPTGVSPIR